MHLRQVSSRLLQKENTSSLDQKRTYWEVHSLVRGSREQSESVIVSALDFCSETRTQGELSAALNVTQRRNPMAKKKFFF